MAKATRDIEMRVGVKQLQAAILDFEKYPSFLNEVVTAKRLPGGTDSNFRVQFELEIIKRFVYVLEFDVTPEKEIAWRLVESDFFKKNEGRWALSPVGEERTRVQYEVDIAVGFLIPGFVSKKLADHNLPSMLSSFEAEAKKR